MEVKKDLGGFVRKQLMNDKKFKVNGYDILTKYFIKDCIPCIIELYDDIKYLLTFLRSQEFLHEIFGEFWVPFGGHFASSGTLIAAIGPVLGVFGSHLQLILRLLAFSLPQGAHLGFPSSGKGQNLCFLVPFGEEI